MGTMMDRDKDGAEKETATTYGEYLDAAESGSVEDVESGEGCWPGDVNLEGLELTESSDLDMEMKQRKEALQEARFILETRGSSPLAPNSSRPPAINDLLRIAGFILTGES